MRATLDELVGDMVQAVAQPSVVAEALSAVEDTLAVMADAGRSDN